MTAKDVYTTALALLGYTDNAEFQRRAVPIFNKVYVELFPIFNEGKEFTPIRSLNESVQIPYKVLLSVMPLGVAEMLALGEGDGELQQYFARDYDRAKARLNRVEQIVDKLPREEWI